MRTVLMCLCALFASAADAALCTLDDSPNTCREKLLRAAETSVVTAADALQSAAAQRLAKINTGPSAAVAPESSAFTDFFSLLNVAAQSDQTGAEDGEALAFEWNRCAPGLSSEGPLQCQIRARLGDSALYEPLKNALADASRASALEDGLDQTDNLGIGLFANLVSERFGRTPHFGPNSIYAQIREQVREELREQTNAAAKAGFQWLAFLESLPAAFDAEDPATRFNAYPDGAGGQRALELYEQTIQPRIAAAVQTQALLERYGYFDLIDLVNNQEQVNGGVQFNVRDELVGPDETRFKISYEFGAVNMGDLHAYLRERPEICARSRPPGSTEWRGVAGCTADFLRRPEVVRSLDSSNRLTLTAEYVRRKRYSITLANDGVALDLPSDHSLVGSLVWGGYIDFVSEDLRATRFDLSASYEDVSNDPARRDRGLANLTLSHSLANGLIASASIVYATKPEFRGEVHKEWSSRIGFNYKFGLPNAGAL